MSTWTCSSCTLNNPADLPFCQACQKSKPEKKTDLTFKPFIKSPPVGFSTWICKLCTTKNDFDQSNCSMCGHQNTSRIMQPRVSQGIDTIDPQTNTFNKESVSNIGSINRSDLPRTSISLMADRIPCSDCYDIGDDIPIKFHTKEQCSKKPTLFNVI